MKRILSVLGICFIWSGAVDAYVGPGAAVTMLGALVGLIGTIGLALWLVFSWPIKRWLAKRRQGIKIQDDAECAENCEKAKAK
ncbi:MAG: hypothetical protein ACSHXK_03025 [Oceanococcus sp.]